MTISQSYSSLIVRNNSIFDNKYSSCIFKKDALVRQLSLSNIFIEESCVLKQKHQYISSLEEFLIEQVYYRCIRLR